MNESWILSFLVMSLLAVGIILSIVWFIHKFRQQKINEQQVMNQFQLEMEQEFVAKDRISQEKETKPPVESKFPHPQEKTPPSPATSPPIPTTDQASQPKSQAVSTTTPLPITEQVIMRLKEANLFESSEGPYFPLDPSGECVLIKLKQKKTALLVPRFESQHFIQNALKRFDYVFLILSKEEVLVINSFSGFIAGHFKL